MYLQSAIIMDETKLPEFIHENIDATARRLHQFSHVVHSRISKWSALRGVVRFENQ